MTSRGWALITGSSAGIGAEFSQLLASEGYNLVLVARDSSNLEQQAQSLWQLYPGIQTEILSADLSVAADVQKVSERISATDNHINVLINNAGFGINQRFSSGDLDKEQYMLDVLVGAVLRLTHGAVTAMKSRGHGEIVIVSSVASFIAGGTYSAAKAWTTVFAESIAQELRGTGVRISALCPGFTRTQFHQRAEMNMTAIPNWLWLDAQKMVAAGWRDHNRGKVVSVPGWQYKLLISITNIAPRPLVRRIGFNARTRSGR